MLLFPSFMLCVLHLFCLIILSYFSLFNVTGWTLSITFHFINSLCLKKSLFHLKMFNFINLMGFFLGPFWVSHSLARGWLGLVIVLLIFLFLLANSSSRSQSLDVMVEATNYYLYSFSSFVHRNIYNILYLRITVSFGKSFFNMFYLLCFYHLILSDISLYHYTCILNWG